MGNVFTVCTSCDDSVDIDDTIINAHRSMYHPSPSLSNVSTRRNSFLNKKSHAKKTPRKNQENHIT